MRYVSEREVTVWYSTVQYGTVQHGTAQHCTAQHGTVQYGTVQYISVQYSAVVILKNSFQFFIFKFPEPSQNKETKVQYSVPLYHAVMNDYTKGGGGQMIPGV